MNKYAMIVSCDKRYIVPFYFTGLSSFLAWQEGISLVAPTFLMPQYDRELSIKASPDSDPQPQNWISATTMAHGPLP